MDGPKRGIAFVLAGTITLGLLTGCGSTSAQRGLTGGAATGAAASWLLGGSSRNVATAALIGGGLGYILGNETDKADAQAQASAERARYEHSRVTSNPSTVQMPANPNSLVGTSWRILSYAGDKPQKQEISSAVITFSTNSKVTTLAVLPDGRTDTWVDNYRLVAPDILIVTGTDPQTGEADVLNATYSIQNGQMVVVAPDRRLVLQRVR